MMVREGKKGEGVKGEEATWPEAGAQIFKKGQGFVHEYLMGNTSYLFVNSFVFPK